MATKQNLTSEGIVVLIFGAGVAALSPCGPLSCEIILHGTFTEK
jgi:hypothetical protein